MMLGVRIGVASKEKIKLKIRASIDGEWTEQEVVALYSTNGTIDVFIYEENMEQFGEVRHFITVQAGKVNIKRSGGVTMNQQFLVGRKTESVYHHPYGNFHLEMDTKRINIEPGRVVLEYMSVINGTEKQEHHLEMMYVKENK